MGKLSRRDVPLSRGATRVNSAPLWGGLVTLGGFDRVTQPPPFGGALRGEVGLPASDSDSDVHFSGQWRAAEW